MDPAPSPSRSSDPEDGDGWALGAEDQWKLAASTLVFAVALVVSHLQGLGMSRDLVLSFVRPIFQLFLVGFVLQFIFSKSSLAWSLLPYALAVVIGGYTAGRRAKHVPKGQYVAGASILVGTLSTMSLLLLLNAFPLTPRYVIPVAGLTVGRAMAITGITLKCLRDDLKLKTHLVETALALGATPKQACWKSMRGALVIALAPVLDTAKTFGLVSLPGAMAGMIISGASPLQAIVLQILLMNTLLCASFLSGVAAVHFSWHVFFTKTSQLRANIFVAD